MSHIQVPSPVHPRLSDWSASGSRDALQLIAEGVTELAGFEIAAISVARDDGHLQVVAVAGGHDVRTQLEGRRTPVEDLMNELEKGDDWGLLKFVPHERLDFTEGNWGWVPDIVPIDCEDAWHPLDLLVAPLRDGDGVLRGTLSIDLPIDGRRPGEAQQRVLQTYAEQAGRAVLTALEREALSEQVRLAEAARTVVRKASSQLSLAKVLEESRAALTEGFRALGMWIETFDETGSGQSKVYAPDGQQVEMARRLVSIADGMARRAWQEQRVLILSRSRTERIGIDQDLGPDDLAYVLDFLDEIAVGSVLFVPLGAGPECLGAIVLTRGPQAPEWTETEAAAALDVGHDLGRAILTARTFEREHLLVEELQALDVYKSQLIATVSHELKNPLTVVTGHLEILASSEDLPPMARRSLAAMDRAAGRLGRVVDDLLLLSRVADPENPLHVRPVDLRRVVDDVLDLQALSAERAQLTLRVQAPDEPVVALGDAEQLDRVVGNLVSNAVKYSRDGRTITVSLRREGPEVVLECADQGFGISAADRDQLFNEFFRSTNPEAIAQPGTGLGLAIVHRIVTRHSGRIEVDSTPGVGSTFRVFLPSA